MKVVYGARCFWWDAISEVGFSPSGLPVCPRCGGVLYETESEAAWWETVDSFEEQEPGTREIIEWSRGRCYPSREALEIAFAETKDPSAWSLRAEYLIPGILIAEEEHRDLDAYSVEEARSKVPKKAMAVRLVEVSRSGQRRRESPRTWLVGEVFTLEQVQMMDGLGAGLNMVVVNMLHNGWERVIRVGGVKGSWQAFGPEDVVLEPVG